MHRTLMRAFPNAVAGGPGRVFFRVDIGRTGEAKLLVQSDRRPDWSTLPCRYLLCEAEWKEFEPEFVRGQPLVFRLRANPTVCRKREGERDGRRVGLLNEKDQTDWLLRKARAGGFGVSSVVIVPEGFRRSRKCDRRTRAAVQRHAGGLEEPTARPGFAGARGREITHFAVRFDGLLTVVDPGVFARTMAEGLGPGKAFGFGLLSVARPQAQLWSP
jgi:CRISPR system Cascade subunit CasE